MNGLMGNVSREMETEKISKENDRTPKYRKKKKRMPLKGSETDWRSGGRSQ